MVETDGRRALKVRAWSSTDLVVKKTVTVTSGHFWNFSKVLELSSVARLDQDQRIAPSVNLVMRRQGSQSLSHQKTEKDSSRPPWRTVRLLTCRPGE